MTKLIPENTKEIFNEFLADTLHQTKVITQVLINKTIVTTEVLINKILTFYANTALQRKVTNRILLVFVRRPLQKMFGVNGDSGKLFRQTVLVISIGGFLFLRKNSTYLNSLVFIEDNNIKNILQAIVSENLPFFKKLNQPYRMETFAYILRDDWISENDEVHQSFLEDLSNSKFVKSILLNDIGIKVKLNTFWNDYFTQNYIGLLDSETPDLSDTSDTSDTDTVNSNNNKPQKFYARQFITLKQRKKLNPLLKIKSYNIAKKEYNDNLNQIYGFQYSGTSIVNGPHTDILPRKLEHIWLDKKNSEEKEDSDFSDEMEDFVINENQPLFNKNDINTEGINANDINADEINRDDSDIDNSDIDNSDIEDNDIDIDEEVSLLEIENLLDQGWILDTIGMIEPRLQSGFNFPDSGIKNLWIPRRSRKTEMTQSPWKEQVSSKAKLLPLIETKSKIWNQKNNSWEIEFVIPTAATAFSEDFSKNIRELPFKEVNKNTIESQLVQSDNRESLNLQKNANNENQLLVSEESKIQLQKQSPIELKEDASSETKKQTELLSEQSDDETNSEQEETNSESEQEETNSESEQEKTNSESEQEETNSENENSNLTQEESNTLDNFGLKTKEQRKNKKVKHRKSDPFLLVSNEVLKLPKSLHKKLKECPPSLLQNLVGGVPLVDENVFMGQTVGLTGTSDVRVKNQNALNIWSKKTFSSEKLTFGLDVPENFFGKIRLGRGERWTVEKIKAKRQQKLQNIRNTPYNLIKKQIGDFTLNGTLRTVPIDPDPYESAGTSLKSTFGKYATPLIRDKKKIRSKTKSIVKYTILNQQHVNAESENNVIFTSQQNQSFHDPIDTGEKNILNPSGDHQTGKKLSTSYTNKMRRFRLQNNKFKRFFRRRRIFSKVYAKNRCLFAPLSSTGYENFNSISMFSTDMQKYNGWLWAGISPFEFLKIVPQVPGEKIKKEIEFITTARLPAVVVAHSRYHPPTIPLSPPEAVSYNFFHTKSSGTQNISKTKLTETDAGGNAYIQSAYSEKTCFPLSTRRQKPTLNYKGNAKRRKAILDSRFQFKAQHSEKIHPGSLNSFYQLVYFTAAYLLLKIIGNQISQELAFVDDTITDALDLKPNKLRNYRIIYNSKRGLKDLVGMEQTLSKCRDLIWTLGLGLPNTKKGILLIGPPGTGKTLFVQALAGEAGVPVIVQPASQLVDNEDMDGAENGITQLFRVARRLGPCILFIDEIDTLGEMRSSYSGSGTTGNLPGSKTQRQNLMLKLLVELDGVTSSNRKILVIGATNRPETLDPALSRPGRMDTILPLPLPSEQKRIALLSFYLKQTETSKTKTSQFLHKNSLSYFRELMSEGARIVSLKLKEKTGITFSISDWLAKQSLLLSEINSQNGGSNSSTSSSQTLVPLQIKSEHIPYLAKMCTGLSAAGIAAAINQSALEAILDSTDSSSFFHTLDTIEHGIESAYRVAEGSKHPERSVLKTEIYKNPLVAYQKVAQILIENETDVTFLGVYPIRTRTHLESALLRVYAKKAVSFLYTSTRPKCYETSVKTDIKYENKLIWQLVELVGCESRKAGEKFLQQHAYLQNVNSTEEDTNEFDFMNTSNLLTLKKQPSKKPSSIFNNFKKLSNIHENVFYELGILSLPLRDWYRIYLYDPEITRRNIDWFPPTLYNRDYTMRFYKKGSTPVSDNENLWLPGRHLIDNAHDTVEKNNNFPNSPIAFSKESIYIAIVSSLFNKTLSILDSNRELLDYLVDYLITYGKLSELEIQKLRQNFYCLG